MSFTVGQRVRVVVSEMVDRVTGRIWPGEDFVRAVNVPCSVALGLVGIEVTGPDGAVHHLGEDMVHAVTEDR